MRAISGVFGAALIGMAMSAAIADPADWRRLWPRTDFSKHAVDFREIKSGGPPKDGIPPIDAPKFERLVAGKASGWAAGIADMEPVIALSDRWRRPRLSAAYPGLARDRQ